MGAESRMPVRVRSNAQLGRDGGDWETEHTATTPDSVFCIRKTSFREYSLSYRSEIFPHSLTEACYSCGKADIRSLKPLCYLRCALHQLTALPGSRSGETKRISFISKPSIYAMAAFLLPPGLTSPILLFKQRSDSSSNAPHLEALVFEGLTSKLSGEYRQTAVEQK
jgi:hypothetical protein